MTLEQIEQFLEKLSGLGPLPGILAPFAETFIPFLPLVLIIAANVNIYGFGFGILFTWIGVITGAICLFLICRRFGGTFGAWIQKRFPKIKSFFNWVEKKSFTPLFLLYCFPFTPSVVITMVSGLSRVPFHTFLVAIIFGKSVMILSIALISFDITNLFTHPWRIIVSILGIILLWFGGKKLESHYATK